MNEANVQTGGSGGCRFVPMHQLPLQPDQQCCARMIGLMDADTQNTCELVVSVNSAANTATLAVRATMGTTD